MTTSSTCERGPVAARCYLATRRTYERAVALSSAAMNGAWLGILSRESLHAVDRAYYDSQRMYTTPEYNRRGLWPWERQVVDAHFGRCRRVIVAAAGGGREVLALRTLGFAADGFECHPGLVRFANDLLRADGHPPSVVVAERDECGAVAGGYDGAIIGWGGYMLIRGRAKRVAFLRQLRELVPHGAPVLLSFFARRGADRKHRVTAAVANALRCASGADPVEVGDQLVPNFVHYFSRADLASELGEAGYDLLQWAEQPYGHAVARIA